MSDSRTLDASVVGREAEPVVSPPVLLRQSREAAGVHIAALAAALKVPVKKLEALEAGRYDELPDMTFARALASSACRQLKIDPAPVLAQIPVGHTPQLGDSSQAINASFRHAQDPAPISAMGWLSRPSVLGAIALLLAALVLVFMPSMEPSPSADAVMAPAASGTEPTTVNEPVPATVPAPLEQTVPAAAVPAAAVVVDDPVVAAAVPQVSAPVAASATVAASSTQAPVVGSLLSITATSESWVEVANGSGSVVMQRMLKSGDTIDFSTAPPYAVVLGRADAVQVMVRGQPFDVTPYARNSVARFEVK